MNCEPPIVETRSGKIRGTREDGLRVFRGIPFAKPPLGPLRFRAPEPPEPWSGVREATRFGPGSYQADRPMAKILGIVVPEQSEDCLTLNVWTPATDGARRPVMVWIHGGAWVIGAGSESAYDGSSLARRGDVVVVTINYRLGAFGYLRGAGLGGALDSSGNESLLDVVAALEWVRDEIAAFGGDPENVTAFGNSAGAVNVSCLLCMERAVGLFHKAIMQSGSLNLTRTVDAALEATRQVMKELGLGASEVDRLRELPAEALLAAANKVAGRALLPPFAPVADGELIPEKPFEAIAAGSARGVPAIVGTNLEEMKLYRALDPTIDGLDSVGLVARCAALTTDGNGARIAETYLAARAARGDDVTPGEIWYAVSTDFLFRVPAMKLAELHATKTPDVFVYRFSWKGATPGRPQGAAHAFELPFVFGTLDGTEIGTIVGASPAAHALSTSMQDAWLAFARSGRPRSDSLPEWPRYASPRRATLELGPEPRVLEAPQESERAIWDAREG
jgi:para-nitrobenzyl esterase